MDAALKPTDEQVAIVDQILENDGNLMIRSLAGTGKTSTLELIQSVIDIKPVLYAVFNKRNADEAEDKFPSTTTIRTWNGLGHRVWMKSVTNKVTLNGKKIAEQLRELIKEAPASAQGPLWDVFWEVIAAVGMAKSVGYVPEGKYPNARRLCTREEFHQRLEEEPDPLVSDLIDQMLFTSINHAYKGYIDFNDQIYMPALFGGTFPKFPFSMFDEVQDLNPVNHVMAEKLGSGRKVAVGDDNQSIYYFRGAMAGGMSKMKEKFAMNEMELSISFRCPEEIVKAAHWRVPQLKAFKPGGHYEQLQRLNMATIPDDAAIICRNNAPLFKLALRLLMAKRSVSVAGSDIGPKIVGIMKKLGDSEMDKESLLARIEDWRAEKKAKNSSTADDMAECMKVFASYGATLGTSISYAEHLFQQSGTIRLITGHKCKGLEWNTVYHLDPWLIGLDEQELNLRYVITTRSRDKLFEINSVGII